MDFDGDGRTDVLSGSFPGELYLFRRTADGRFAEAETLEDKNGRPIHLRYNASVFAHDWDADGDLDLVVWGYRGHVCLLTNEGNRESPAFGEPQELEAAGKPVRGISPYVADWDGDGKDDLLVCRGGVDWYRNTGEKGKPVLQAPVTLVPAGHYESIKRRHDEPLRMPEGYGSCRSVCATDFNGDGRLDLLVGDTWFETVELPELTEKQQAAKQKIDARLSVLTRQRGKLHRAPANETREARIQRQREYLGVCKEIALARPVAEELRRPQRNRHGCVWLFERTAAGP